MSGLPIDVEQLDPQRLMGLLLQQGWVEIGGRAGAYSRLVGSEETDPRDSLLIPLDKSAPDYRDLMTSVTLDLQQRGQGAFWSRLAWPLLSVTATDTVLFHRETSVPSGLIPWRQGEALIEAARASLVAGAKAFMGPRRHFGNRYGTFANRYLDSTLMGQTAPGSYVVTAHVPVDAAVQLKGSQMEPLGFPGVDVASAREVTVAVARSMDATMEAVDHYRRTASMSAFEDGVSRGISFEITEALRDLASNSDGASIDIRWDATSPDAAFDPAAFTLRPADVAILGRAAAQLAEYEAINDHVAHGRVHLLTRQEAGGPGVVGVDDGERKIRVPLQDERQYHEAVLAHDQDGVVTVRGRLQREGNLFWLYDATLIDVWYAPGNERASSAGFAPMEEGALREEGGPLGEMGLW